MTPHAPNLFALGAGVRTSIDTGSTAEYHISSAVDAIDYTAAVLVDKKRARPPEEATRARKKVASELMAFEYVSPNVGLCLQSLLSASTGTQKSF
ncbi:hypothetical protein EC968_008188 [Mortierella alpina]|nr:hypothetical protein EC968_008188 [Mortierella alpina]